MKDRIKMINEQLKIMNREVLELYCRAEKSGKLDVEHLQLLDNYRHHLMTELAKLTNEKAA